MTTSTLSVDYYFGAQKGPNQIQKWFSCWHRLLQGEIDSRFISVRQKYVPERSAGVLVNLYLQSLIVVLRRRAGAILHIPSQLLCGISAPFWSHVGPNVITCHDAIPYLSENLQLTGGSYSRMIIQHQRHALQKAEAILVDSEYTRKDLVEKTDLKLSPQCIHLVYLGVDAQHYAPRPRDVRMMARYNFATDRANLLYVGSEAPRKNLEGIVKAMDILRNQGIPTRLVKIGARELRGARFHELIHTLELDDDIIQYENVPETDLPYLYNAADVFVFPSFYEGFGMPVLEAMASGCPVVTSTMTSLPELAEGAAVLVAPQDAEAIADGIKQILTSAPLQQELVRQGLERVRQFSWKKTAQSTLQIYQGLAGHSRSGD
ncbi:MAG: glycosyltransferase family 4 protein [Anaerolineae bacterium]|nr:glycosyltransferase family 4 protein [Anaerolineae bacterium]